MIATLDVLKNGSQEELAALVDYLDKPWDMFVKSKTTYKKSVHDLRQIASFIEEKFPLGRRQQHGQQILRRMYFV